MEYRLSVVIPAYNSEKTLPETIDCILGQSLRKNDIQIIIVNDGSTDGTLQVIKDYAGKYSNIKAVDKENGGVSSARNAGIEAAEGKYLAFLDADDLVTPESYKNILDKMDSVNAGMAVFRMCRFGFGGNEFNPVCEKLAKSDDISPYDLSLIWNFLIGNKVFLTSMVKESGVLFPPTKYSEDGAFIMSVIMKMQPKITGVYSAVEKYRRTDPAEFRSVSQSIRTELIEDYEKSMQIILDRVNASFENGFGKGVDKEEYFQEIYRKICSTYINEFYRKIWHSDESDIELAGCYFSKYYNLLTDTNKEKTAQDDIGIPPFSKKETAGHPLLSVLVKKPSDDFTASLFNQNMVMFELITPNPGKTDFPNVKSGAPAGRYKVSFSGRNPLDPRVLRVMVLLRKKAVLPMFIIKHATFLLLKIKDLINR